jgi:hypothetical protein
LTVASVGALPHAPLVTAAIQLDLSAWQVALGLRLREEEGEFFSF